MQNTDKTPKRGRPKTFDRSHVIDTAMQAYWTEGHAAVSLNALCQRAGVAKTSLYKEFGSEDGLKQAVLVTYHKMTLAPLYKLLEADKPFTDSLPTFCDYILRDHRELGMPNGCLFVEMCQTRVHLGALTADQVDQFQSLSLKKFEYWIAEAQRNGELDLSVSPATAAQYVDAQIATIMTLQRQGVPLKDLEEIFRLALSVFA